MMQHMREATVIHFEGARERGRRVRRAVDARRALQDRRERRGRERVSGRVWVNGAELGGARGAYSHLGESYD
jgi:hypothetical protein